MNIHQVSVSYVQEHDRLMIRINGKDGGELRAWLTRRLALALMPLLGKMAADQIQKIASPTDAAASLEDKRGQLLTAFQKEASLRNGDFETPYREPAQPADDLPLEPEPLLLTEIKVTMMSNDQLRLQLFEKLPGREAVRNFQVMMDAQLSNGLLQLLHQGLKSSQWLEAPAVLTPAADLVLEASTDTGATDLSIETEKPKYLN